MYLSLLFNSWKKKHIFTRMVACECCVWALVYFSQCLFSFMFVSQIEGEELVIFHCSASLLISNTLDNLMLLVCTSLFGK